MIGCLPRALTVGGTPYAIRTDFRVIINLFRVFCDPDLDEKHQLYTVLKTLYFRLDAIPQSLMQEAAQQAYWFLDGGDTPKVISDGLKTFDWKQDEGILFPAVNKVAGYETRACQYLHWWTFLGFFNEIDKGLFATVLYLRQKRLRGQPLSKDEKEIYRTHKNLINLYTEQDKADIAETERFLKALTGE